MIKKIQYPIIDCRQATLPYISNRQIYNRSQIMRHETIHQSNEPHILLLFCVMFLKCKDVGMHNKNNCIAYF